VADVDASTEAAVQSTEAVGVHNTVPLLSPDEQVVFQKVKNHLFAQENPIPL